MNIRSIICIRDLLKDAVDHLKEQNEELTLECKKAYEESIEKYGRIDQTIVDDPAIKARDVREKLEIAKNAYEQFMATDWIVR